VYVCTYNVHIYKNKHSFGIRAPRKYIYTNGLRVCVYFYCEYTHVNNQQNASVYGIDTDVSAPTPQNSVAENLKCFSIFV